MKQIVASFSVSPRILDHLGIAAYNSLRKCLAELAANSYDATSLSISLPDSIGESPFIDMKDNGVGISPIRMCAKVTSSLGERNRERIAYDADKELTAGQET